MAINLANIEKNTVVRTRNGELRRIQYIEEDVFDADIFHVEFFNNKEKLAYDAAGRYGAIETLDDIVKIVAYPIDVFDITLGSTVTINNEKVFVHSLSLLGNQIEINNRYMIDYHGNVLNNSNYQVLRVKMPPSIPLKELPEAGCAVLRNGKKIEIKRTDQGVLITDVMYHPNGTYFNNIALDIVGFEKEDPLDLSTLKEGDVCILRDGRECEKAVWFIDGCQYQYRDANDKKSYRKSCGKDGLLMKDSKSNIDIVRIKRALDTK